MQTITSSSLLVSRLQCKYFSCQSLMFQTLEMDISSKINVIFFFFLKLIFNQMTLRGGNGTNPAISHLVVPRINFPRSAEGYNAGLIHVKCLVAAHALLFLELFVLCFL